MLNMHHLLQIDRGPSDLVFLSCYVFQTFFKLKR
uniref:Uncharacterized protein n=1 Tax=Lepeophtheirus salmonis TaxID=72036 RepID=A0A0K2VLT4_LEPSM